MCLNLSTEIYNITLQYYDDSHQEMFYISSLFILEYKVCFPTCLCLLVQVRLLSHPISPLKHPWPGPARSGSNVLSGQALFKISNSVVRY